MSRQRWLYTSGGTPLSEPIRIDEGWTDEAAKKTGDLEKFSYDNLQATDGTDISSRTKRREYMKRHGLTDPSDFKETWDRAAKERAAYLRGERVNPELRHAVGKAEYEASKKRRR